MITAMTVVDTKERSIFIFWQAQQVSVRVFHVYARVMKANLSKISSWAKDSNREKEQKLAIAVPQLWPGAIERILIRHPCMQDEPTLSWLSAHAAVSFCVTGSERVCPISARRKIHGLKLTESPLSNENIPVTSNKN